MVTPLLTSSVPIFNRALEIFGLQNDAQPGKQAIAVADKTEVSAYWLREDSVIEQDARSIPAFEMTKLHVTGRALFRRGNEVLEVITANRRPLERVLGVDLIYHNVVRRCLVMVQYKMLDPATKRDPGFPPDWIYRPDRNLTKEIQRMKVFAKKFPRLEVWGRLGLGVGAGGLLLIALALAVSPVLLVPGLLLTGASLGLSMQVYTLIAQAAASRDAIGATMATLTFSRQIGNVLGIAVFGWVLVLLPSMGLVVIFVLAAAVTLAATLAAPNSRR